MEPRQNLGLQRREITTKKRNVEMRKFEIRAYTKKELAMCYFPSAENAHSAVNRLMAWINRCEPLSMALAAQGYQKMARWFSPKEVRIIVEHLGEP